MIENLTNKTFHKKIHNQLCINELILDNVFASQNPSEEKKNCYISSDDKHTYYYFL